MLQVVAFPALPTVLWTELRPLSLILVSALITEVYGPCEKLGVTYNLTPLWLRISSPLVELVFAGMIALRTEGGAMRRCCVEAGVEFMKGTVGVERAMTGSRAKRTQIGDI